MELIIRPAHDRFLDEVAFPAFTLGMTDSAAAFQSVLDGVADPRTRVLAETLLERDVGGTFDSLRESDSYLEWIYRLLFSDWKDAGGWKVNEDYSGGFAGDYDEVFHLAMMIENPDYDYGNASWAAADRETWHKAPNFQFPFVSLIGGLWEPPPTFYPEWVLTTVGRGAATADRQNPSADWAYRGPRAIRILNDRLPKLLNQLLDREQDRLRPIDVPEVKEIHAYWLGKAAMPPLLAVAFSGLGARATSWVGQIGNLASVIRTAAHKGQGLTALVTAAVNAPNI